MTVEDRFQRQITELEKRRGQETKLHTYEVLSEVVKWLYESGNGNITLSAENHLLRQKNLCRDYYNSQRAVNVGA